MRLIGALLAAAHGRRGEDPDLDRALIQRLCEAGAPEIVAPRSESFERADGAAAAELRGASRWAPLNFFDAKAVRKQAGVDKVGVAIGDRLIHYVWPELEFADEDRDRLAALFAEVSFLGTSRSPVIAMVSHEEPADPFQEAWLLPSGGGAAAGTVDGPSTHVRVPDDTTVSTFDARHTRFASASDMVEKANLVAQSSVGRTISYRFSSPELAAADVDSEALDPQHWQDILVLAVDSEHSDLVPKAPAAYMVARALRVALLGAFDREGTAGEAPEILRARGTDPHCAIVPMANVGFDHSDGRVLGVAIVFPHRSRVADLATQRERVESGLADLVKDNPEDRRYLSIPGAGKVLLKQQQPGARPLASLDRTRYTRPGREWVTVTPVVHSRWPKAKTGGIAAEIARDCEYVGLPSPKEYEVLRSPALSAAPRRQIDGKQLPEGWRSLLQGPTSHLRLRFDRPVRGPLLLGRARHFGVGLLMPVPETVEASEGVES